MTDKQRLALYNEQAENHLCVHCKKVLEICDRWPSDNMPWCETHTDINACEYFANSCYGGYLTPDNGIACEIINGNSNTRIYSHGMETVDIGGGYDIIACPYYEELPDVVFRPIKYAAYMKSPEWKKKRYPALVRDGFKCAMCGTAKNLIVHHITYERLGHEDMDDLITLCKDCHAKVHENDLAKKGANYAE